jgi:hypothetical protein
LPCQRLTRHSSGPPPVAAELQRNPPVPDALPTSVLETARRFWREFVAAWLFPPFFLFGGVAAERLEHPGLFFWLLALPLFFWSFGRASRPWVRREVRYWHAVTLGMLVPFGVFALSAYARLVFMAHHGG